MNKEETELNQEQTELIALLHDDHIGGNMSDQEYIMTEENMLDRCETKTNNPNNPNPRNNPFNPQARNNLKHHNH